MGVPESRRLRLATATALVVGPALFLLDNLIHPEEFEQGNEAEQLTAIAEAADRWQIAHLIGFISVPFFALVIIGLAAIVHRSQPGLAIAAAAAGIVGLMGFAFALALDGYTWGVLGDVYADPGIDAATLEAAFEEVQGSAWTIPYSLLSVAWLGAMLALAWAAARGGWIGAPAAVLLGAGSLAVWLEGLIPDNAYFIASSALLLVGGVAAARDVARLDDARLAGVRSA